MGLDTGRSDRSGSFGKLMINCAGYLVIEALDTPYEAR